MTWIVAPLDAAWVVAAFGAAVWLVWPIARRTRLGAVHPAVAWLLLEAAFFGVGSVVLAVRDGDGGPALYVGGAALAFAAAAGASDSASRRRRRGGLLGEPASAPSATSPVEMGTRRWAPGLLAILSIAVLGPLLIGSGIPFLTRDITGARAELVGLPVQLIRVALPGLAGLLMLDAMARWPSGRTRRDPGRAAVEGVGSGRQLDARQVADLVGIVAIAAFLVLLASRYLIAELGATLLVAWWITGRRVPLRIAGLIAVAVIVGFGLLQVVRAYDQAAGNEVGFAIERTVDRVLLIQPRTLAALERAIPADEPYFLGSTWVHRLGPILGRPDIPNLGYWIYPRVVAGSQDTAGYAAPGLLGEAWANFGPFGLLLFAILGAVAERLGALVAGRRASALDVVMSALMILFLARTHALGLGGVALLIVLVVAWRLLAGPSHGLIRAARAVAAWRPAVADPE